MSARSIVGLAPWLPQPLARMPWWTEPIRAERLAALRIGVGLVMLWDIFGTYWTRSSDFFGSQSLGSPAVFAQGQATIRWTALAWIDDPQLLRVSLALWGFSALLLTLGLLPRTAAALCWMFSTSIIGLNYYLHNSGDNVRTIVAFYLALCPCGAVWALQNRWRAKSEGGVFVHPWPIRLLTIQLAAIYFFNGVYKLNGAEWRDGTIMHWVMGNLGWTRMSYAQLPIPDSFCYVETWLTLFWELFFPILIAMPFTRGVTLGLGVFFHVSTAALLQLGAFPYYMICLYLPFVPWEKWLARRATLNISPSPILTDAGPSSGSPPQSR